MRPVPPRNPPTRDPVDGSPWNALIELVDGGEEMVGCAAMVDVLLDVRNDVSGEHERLAIDVALTYVSGRKELPAVECELVVLEIERMIRRGG